MAFPFLLAAAVVGTGMSIYGQIKGAEADAEAMKRNAASRELEASEIMKRTKVNQDILEEEGQILLGDQETFLGSRGTTFGSPLLILTRTATKIAREKSNMQMESEFRAHQLRSGANISRGLADERKQAGQLGAAGTLLTSGARIYDAGRK